MTIDYEAEYNNRGRVPEHPEIFARWALGAAAFRASRANAELGLAHGNSAREKIDLFWPAAGRGYWRSLDAWSAAMKATNSFATVGR